MHGPMNIKCVEDVYRFSIFRGRNISLCHNIRACFGRPTQPGSTRCCFLGSWSWTLTFIWCRFICEFLAHSLIYHQSEMLKHKDKLFFNLKWVSIIFLNYLKLSSNCGIQYHLLSLCKTSSFCLTVYIAYVFRVTVTVRQDYMWAKNWIYVYNLD